MPEMSLTRWAQRLSRPDLATKMPDLETRCLKARHLHEKLELCNRALLDWLQSLETPTFALAGVLAFIGAVNERGLTRPLRYQISSFESWLTRRSGLSQNQQREIRARVMGQLLPRADYEKLFPIGQGRVLPSSHIVTGHSAPDLDTTTASFWAWCDAWAAPVAQRLHYWNVPGGLPPLVEVGLFFEGPFGPQIGELAKARGALTLTAFDLLARKEPPTTALQSSLVSLPVQAAPVAVLGAGGALVGELRQPDVDRIRQITNPFMACLHWFERYTEQVLVDFLAQSGEKGAVQPLLERLLALQIGQADPFCYETPEQQGLLCSLLKTIFSLEAGPQTAFQAILMQSALLCGSQNPVTALERLTRDYVASRDEAAGFLLLSEVSHLLGGATQSIRNMLERVDQALLIKEKVLEVEDLVVQGAADVEELLQRMGDHHALLSAVVDADGTRLLEGMILAEDLRRQPVGTVSTRDFCNREEVKIPAYLAIASVFDHHKASLQTARPLTAMLADVQSANTLMAEQMLHLQEPYAAGGMVRNEIDSALKALAAVDSPSSMRRRQRLLSKLQALDRVAASGPEAGWVAPERQWWQAIQTLFAILDDTDLLTKVSWRDLRAVMHLLNLLGSLEACQEIELVSMDDLMATPEQMETAAQRLKESELLSGLLKLVLTGKEKALNEEIEGAAAEQMVALFADTKILNRCAAVGQIKLFPANQAPFQQNQERLQGIWLQQSQDMHKQRSEVDLFIQMISSIQNVSPGPSTEGSAFEPDAVDRSDRDAAGQSFDQLWIWAPPPEASRVHLRVFLSNLVRGPLSGMAGQCRVHLVGPAVVGLERLYAEQFSHVSIEPGQPGATAAYAVLEYPQGRLNSRKAQITPCLPQL